MKFTKYHDKGAYHWGWLSNSDSRYFRHATKLREWIGEKDVLDVGAGDGAITAFLGIKGVDDEPEAVRLAVENGADVMLATAYNLPFDDEEFDSVLMADVLEHIKHPLIVLEEVRRVLKQYLYIVSPVPEGRDKFHYQEWTMEELKELVESKGFELVEPMTRPKRDKRIYAKFRKA